jgi:hypothetical protein
MKKILMRTILAFLLILGMSSTSLATPITGSIAFSGEGGTNNNLDLTLATAFLSSIAVVDTVSGDYTGVPLLSLSPVVTFNGFTIIQPSVIPLWSFSFGGKNYAFDATSMVRAYVSVDEIIVDGAGTASITGFDVTPGTWSITAQHLGNVATEGFSFSASSAAIAPVPEPLTLTLLGLGLLGLAGAKRKFKK